MQEDNSSSQKDSFPFLAFSSNVIKSEFQTYSGGCFAFINQEEIKQNRKTNSNRILGKEQIDLLITKQGDRRVCSYGHQ